VADLRARQYTVAASDEVAASTRLEAASAAVREAAGCPISLTTSTVMLYPGTCASSTRLPGGPVRTITSVTVGGVAAAASSWSLREGQLWMAYPLDVGDGLQVTYVHGYDPVPADIVDLVCELAGAALLSAEPRDPRAAAEAIDDSRTTWQTGADATVSIMELPERTRLSLSRRFGGGAYVTGR
jgi:hypothetical protein